MDTKKSPEKCNLCNVLLEVQKKKNKRVVIRRAIDPISNKLLVMCNACGLRLSRAGWRNKREAVKTIAPVEKEVCLKGFDIFTKALCDVLQDSNANKLYCPALTPKLCQCIQHYLVRSDFGKNDIKQLIEGNAENIDKEKATELNELNKKAKLLIKQKAPKPADQNLTTNEMKGILNLRSKEYEEFVLINRERLKKRYNLCERGVQRILCYSNNYLHKQLKTSPNGEARIASKSRVVARLLPDIKTLFEKRCCSQQCTRLALTHSRLIERWRNKALSGQKDARTVLAEMLTPAGGAVNCSAFLRLVTGCSPGLLYKVKKDMAQSAGVREPPEHGLRKYWRYKKNSDARNYDDSGKNIAEPAACSVANDRSTTDPSSNIEETFQTNRPSILRKKSSDKRKIADKSSASFLINIDSNNCEKVDANGDRTATLNDTVLQHLFSNDINNGNCSQDDAALSLPVVSSDIIDCNETVNITEDGCVNQINMIPYILTPEVNSGEETNLSIVDKDSDCNGQRVQFIEITKLTSSDPPTSGEVTVTVPLMLVIS